ncbi:hypothetical protein N7454_000579 [Penicillium verhagenii]|nr:hypothetical protein N7454_000579 [Penicillium verhagenii]
MLQAILPSQQNTCSSNKEMLPESSGEDSVFWAAMSLQQNRYNREMPPGGSGEDSVLGPSWFLGQSIYDQEQCEIKQEGEDEVRQLWDDPQATHPRPVVFDSMHA